MGDIQERDSAWWTMGFRVVPQNVQTYHDICGGFLSHGVPPNPKSSQIIQVIRLIWDHLWLIGGLEHLFLLVHILVMSKKTNWRSPSFFRGVGQPPTSHWWPFKYWNLWLGGPPKTPRQLSSEDEAMRAHEALNGKAIMGHRAAAALGQQPWGCPRNMGVGQNLLLSILVGWTSIYQLFWCSPGAQGFDTLPHGDTPNGWLDGWTIRHEKGWFRGE